jgi:hypothetical protein
MVLYLYQSVPCGDGFISGGNPRHGRVTFFCAAERKSLKGGLRDPGCHSKVKFAFLPPLQGEGRGGDGVSVTPLSPKPTPILIFPLRGKGLLILGHYVALKGAALGFPSVQQSAVVILGRSAPLFERSEFHARPK